MSEKAKAISASELEKVQLPVSVELGRAKISIKELGEYMQGSVIELDRLAGEPLNIYIGDKLIARGEAVVVNEKFGVRITDVVKGE
jgi:flagellar motor switch protein FliN/FliY